MKAIFKSLSLCFLLFLLLSSCGSDKIKTQGSHSNSSGECDAERCKGTTVEGKRCKNETKNCNRYCHVHQGQQ